MIREENTPIFYGVILQLSEFPEPVRCPVRQGLCWWDCERRTLPGQGTSSGERAIGQE